MKQKTFELWHKDQKVKFEVTATKREGKEWLALCPEHDDHNESLRINEEKRCYHCFVCGFAGPLYNSNRRNNTNQRKKIIAIYDYKDEKGRLIFQVVRYHPKKFSQRQPNGKGGWIDNIKGTRRVLYRLPEILRAPDPVFVVEGEKDVDNLWKWGLTATTSPMGVRKWRKEYNKPLARRSVILIPDNDKSGIEHMEEVGKNLYGKAKEIKWLELPGLDEKEDVSD